MGLPRLLTLLKVALLATLLASGAAPAMAQTGLAGMSVPVCVAPDNSNASATAMLGRAATFDCTTQQTSFGPGNYWVRSAPLSLTGPINIRVASLWQHDMTLYAVYADGKVVTVPIDGRGASRRIQLGAIVEQSLPARGVPLVRLLWHVRDAANLRGILLGASVATPAESATSNLRMAALYAAFGGLALALLVYNLALWAALRHRFQLAYCTMLLGLFVYAASSSGALAWAWPWIANNDRLRVNYASLAVAASSAIMFARSFFEPPIFAGWLSRMAIAVCIGMLGTAAAMVLIAPWQIALFDRLYALTFVGQMSIIAPVLWRGWKLRSNYLWLFAIGWAAPIALAAARVLAALNLSQWNFWIDNSTLISMALEALLSSMAIAYRMHLLTRERDEAKQQEIAARMLADIDPLTGLLNRRAFLSRAIGREDDQILLIVDIDHFKRVNDTIGHDGGDEVLRVFARTLRQSAPADALVARFGGEEFAIVVPATRALPGEEILARLRACRMPFDLTVTASIGMCRGPLVKESDWKALYRGADHALFEAKSGGRDRVRAMTEIAHAA